MLLSTVRLFFFIFLASLSFNSPARAGEDEIALQLNWRPTHAFSGFYLAQEEGLYRDADLQVRFLHGGPDVNPVQSVVSGQAQIGLTVAKRLVQARLDGHRLMAIAAIFRRSPVVFVSEVDRGITDPRQFKGLRIRATPDLVPMLRSITARVGLASDDYEVLSLKSDVALFEQGVADVWGAHITGLALKLTQRGHQLNYVFPSDYGVSSLGGVIFAREDYLAVHGPRVGRFLAASLEGLQRVVEDTSRTGDLVRLHAPDADIDYQNRRMEASVPLIHTGEHRLGWMKDAAWKQILAQQGSDGLIAGELYTNRFLEVGGS